MPTESVLQAPSTQPEILLTEAEWAEICDCSSALNAAITKCEGLEGDEPAELVRSVQMRFGRAVHSIQQRLYGD